MIMNKNSKNHNNSIVRSLNDILSKASGDADNFIESNQNLLNASTDSINIKLFESRESLIDKLLLAICALTELSSKLNNVLMKAQDARSQEIAAVDLLVNKNKRSGGTIEQTENEPDSQWTTVVTKRKPDPLPQKMRSLRSYADAMNKIDQTPSKIISADNGKYSKIKITENISLNAVIVNSFDAVKQDGELYYVEPNDHFAIKIMGHLYHGNIGVIYTEEKYPEKIKDCKFSSSCMKHEKCDYYHDPRKFPGSADHRNYIASSYLYAPPTSHYKNKPRSRRFGSRNYLDHDLDGLQDEEVGRFNDQTMHDLLCSLILNASRNTPKSI